MFGEIEADPEANQHSDHRPQQTPPQFLEMLKKGHRAARELLWCRTGFEAHNARIPDCCSHFRHRLGNFRSLAQP
jgi:hypothetical protein